MMFIIGQGGEGKSRIAIVLREIFGDSMSTGNFQRIENDRFFCYNLKDKLLMVGDNYRFTISDKTKLNVKETMQDSCNISEFLADSSRVTYGEKLCVTSSSLYNSYYSWCEDNALAALKRETFISWIKQNEEKLKIHYSTNISSGGKNVRGFKGI